MQHGMTVWAHWDQVLDRVYGVLTTAIRDRKAVVDFDEVLADFSIAVREIEAADKTFAAVLPDAGASGLWVALVAHGVCRRGSPFNVRNRGAGFLR